MRKTTIILSLLLACVCVDISFGQKKFELADVTKLTGMSDPQISPNSKSIVVVVSRPDLDKNASLVGRTTLSHGTVSTPDIVRKQHKYLIINSL